MCESFLTFNRFKGFFFINVEIRPSVKLQQIGIWRNTCNKGILGNSSYKCQMMSNVAGDREIPS